MSAGRNEAAVPDSRETPEHAAAVAPADASVEDAAAPIIRVGSAHQLEALARLLGADLAGAEQFVTYARETTITLDALWSLRTPADRITASVLAVPSPGRTAMLFATTPRTSVQAREIGALIDHACRCLPDLNVQLAQALLDPVTSEEHRAFELGGFHKLADLAYFERSLPRRPTEPVEWPGDVTASPYVEADRDEWLAALDASYIDTLDCPGLRGLRRTSDVLIGHQGAGRFDPTLWTLLRVGGEPAGVLMLNAMPSTSAVPTVGAVELAYLGLGPVARGRGLGSALMRHGLHLITTRRERSLTLAVDERNEPALHLYRAHGLRKALRRAAYIRALGTVRSCST